jgi:hypothetical protein
LVVFVFAVCVVVLAAGFVVAEDVLAAGLGDALVDGAGEDFAAGLGEGDAICASTLPARPKLSAEAVSAIVRKAFIHYFSRCVRIQRTAAPYCLHIAADLQSPSPFAPK